MLALYLRNLGDKSIGDERYSSPSIIINSFSSESETVSSKPSS